MVTEGAVRILRQQWTPTYKEQLFKELGYQWLALCLHVHVYLITHSCRRDPFYIGKQVLFSVFTGFSYRKDFELKDELNWVMGQLHAAGFWDKWNSDQFVREVSEKK